MKELEIKFKIDIGKRQFYVSYFIPQEDIEKKDKESWGELCIRALEHLKDSEKRQGTRKT